MNDWEILKARYGSNRQYLNRELAICGSEKWEEFKNFLIDQGADILTRSIQNEKFRFKLSKKIGIVYENHSGDLLAHNMGAEFNRLIGQDSTELYYKDQYYAKFDQYGDLIK